MNDEWAINGHRVVRVIPYFSPPELVVTDAAGIQTARLVLLGTEWELLIGTRTYSVGRMRAKDAIGATRDRISRHGSQPASI